MSKRLFCVPQSLAFALGTMIVAASPQEARAAQAAFYDAAKSAFVYTSDGKPIQVKTQADWAACRKAILRNMEEVMGPLPDAGKRVPLDVQVIEERKSPGFVMKKITFAAEKDDRVPAWLFFPASGTSPHPAMLCLHQTTHLGKDEPAGLGGSPNLHYAKELAELGFVTLAPDYPGYGESRANPYRMGYPSGTIKGIWNHIRAVDLLQSLPEVDPKRIGCIGHSLGGHNTLFVAAFDERIKVVVTSCGFTSFPKYYGGKLAGWAGTTYMPRITSVYGNDPAKVPFDFTGILACLAPRTMLINAPVQDSNFECSGVDDCVLAAKSVYSLFNAGDRITVFHPKGGHDFPPEVRKAIYDKIAAALQP